MSDSYSPYNSRLLRIYRIIECPICSDTFGRTAVLPCSHTFCLRCLSRCIVDEGQGSQRVIKVTCPICRRRFELEDEHGLLNLPRNFVVEGVVETLTGRSAVASQDDETKRCAMCCGLGSIEDSETTGVDPSQPDQAIQFCRQCRHHLCVSCAAQHKLVFPLHRVCPVGNSKASRHLKRRQHSHLCHKHKKDELSFYCFHCLTTACVTCRHQFHRHHDCPPIRDVFDDFVDEMQYELNEVTDFCSTTRYVCEVLERNKDRVRENCASVRESILCKNAQLKNLIDDRTNELLQQLVSLQDARLSYLDRSQGELSTRLSALDTFVKCYERLKNVAAPHDVALRIAEFHEKSAMLLDVTVIAEAAQAREHLPRLIFENSTQKIEPHFGNISFEKNADRRITEKPRLTLYSKIRNNESLMILFVVIFIIIFAPLRGS